jgi:outer membrane lipoprotein SlyB
MPSPVEHRLYQAAADLVTQDTNNKRNFIMTVYIDPAPQSTPPAGRGKHHPLMIAAAIAVILFCLAGTAAILGWLPTSIGGNAPKSDLTEFDKANLSAKMEQDGRQSSPAMALVSPDGRATNQGNSFQGNNLQGNNLQGNNLQGRADQGRIDPVPLRDREPDYASSGSQHRSEPRHVAQAAPEKAWCAHCGNVESVRAIKQRAQGSGLGAAGGAVLGGLLGHQIGGGHGRQLATVAGAVGGAVVGNQVEGNMKATTSYEITVRLDDGSARTFHQNSAPRWEAGDRVKVVKGALHSA